MKKEVCVGSLEAARLVSKMDIDRIETCIALEQGGLTPSKAMVTWIQNTFDLEQHVLIRQRPGGFCYTYDEIVVMRDQILELKTANVAGFVVGALTKDRTIDSQALETWKRTAEGFDFTFHRAFDEVKDWKKAIDELVRLGFKRILTSGLAENVTNGMKNYQDLMDYANGRIEIMAGGGLKPVHATELKSISIDAVHFSGTEMMEIDTESRFRTTVLVPNEKLLTNFIQEFKS